MRSSASSSVLLLSALLAAPVYSSPLSIKREATGVENRSAASAVFGTLASLAASTVTGSLLSEIEDFFSKKDAAKRSLTEEQSAALHAILAAHFPSEVAKRTLTPEESAGLHAILEAHFPTGLARRSPLSIGKVSSAPKPATPAAAKPASSSSGLGSAIAASAAGGAVSATITNLLNKIESLFGGGDKRDFVTRSLTDEQKEDLHAILAEHFADSTVERRLFSAKPSAVKPAAVKPASSGSGLGSAIAASAIGGAASATVSNIIAKIESLFSKRDFDESSLTDAQKTELTDALNQLISATTSVQRRAVIEEPEPVAAPATEEEPASSGLGAAVASSAAGGAVGATVSNLLGKIEDKIESLFSKRDFAERSLTDEQKADLHDSLVEYFGGATVERRLFSAKPSAAKPAAVKPASSGSGLGSAIAASAIGGAASATVSNIIAKIESLFSKRDFEERSLTDEQKADLHAILAEHFADSTVERRLFSSKPAAVKPASSSGSGLGSAIAASALGGAASATVSNIINKIESLFEKRDFAERSLTDEQKADLHDTLVEYFGGATVERRLFSAKPSAVKPVAVKPASSSSGLGSAIAASALGGAASAAVSNIISKIESLFKRDFAERSLTDEQKATLHDILAAHFGGEAVEEPSIDDLD